VKEIDGKYDVVRQLGEGGMGCVYEARHKMTSRRVAVKLILEEARLEPAAVTRFQREARAAGSIESEHITQVLDGGVDPASNAPYLVMELLSGEDVDALIKRLGALRPELALRIIAQMLAGLERAHVAGVVHRDIKPANVFLAKKDGDEIVVKLCDFGIAKVKTDPFAGGQDHALTQSSTLIGSPLYMSPEQAKGAKDLDARADVWSAGIVLYQLLSGRTPYQDADTLGLLLLAICSEKAPSVQTHAPWVSAEIAAVVERALDMNLDTRFQSAAAMRDAIVALLPNGTRLDASMLTPLTDEERAFVAPAPEPRPSSKEVVATSVSVPAAIRARAVDGPAKASETAAPVEVGARAKGTGRARIAIAFAAAGIVAIVGWRIVKVNEQPSGAGAGMTANAIATTATASTTASATATTSATPTASATASTITAAIASAPTRSTTSRAALSNVAPKPSDRPAPSAPPAASSAPGVFREFH
jgi:serine/threonine-protein kinase